MKKLFTIFFSLLSTLCFSQDGQYSTVKQLRLRNNTDSTSTAATTDGTIIYNTVSDKFRFRQNGAWVSFLGESAADNFWNTTGTTNITDPTISGNPTFIGSSAGAGISIFKIQNSTPLTIVDLIGTGQINHTVSASAGSIYNWAASGTGTVATMGTSGNLMFGTQSTNRPSISPSTSSGVINAAGRSLLFNTTLHTSNGTTSGVYFGHQNVAGVTSGTLRNVVLGGTSTGFSPSSGSADYIAFEIDHSFNTTGTYSGTARGIYIDPTLTSTTGLTWIAFENTSGQIRFTLTQDDTKDRVLVQDGTSNQVFWRDASTLGGVSGSTGSTDNAILVADGTGGSTIKASNATIDASGNISTSGTVATEEIQGDDISITASSTMHMQANGGDINIATEHIHIDPTQNLTFFSTAPNPTEYGGGVNVIHLSEASMVPNSNPTSGSILYAESGAFKARGTSGTVTTIAPADPHCPSCGSDFVCEYENEKYGYLAMCFKCLSENMDKPRRKRKPFFTTVKGAWSKHKNPTP